MVDEFIDHLENRFQSSQRSIGPTSLGGFFANPTTYIVRGFLLFFVVTWLLLSQLSFKATTKRRGMLQQPSRNHVQQLSLLELVNHFSSLMLVPRAVEISKRDISLQTSSILTHEYHHAFTQRRSRRPQPHTRLLSGTCHSMP